MLFIATCLVVVLQVVMAKMSCPGSDAMLHASCQVTTTFESSCATVQSEISKRVAGQYDLWHDPHNNGTYTVTATSNTEMQIQRLTGDKKYTDKMVFTFTSTSASNCKLEACSESQVTSLLDYSTNYCNIHDL